MVELPEPPAIRIVAVAAGWPQRLLVPVILHVTGCAFPRCISISRCEVAPLAGDGSVKPHERKTRQPVIKLHLRIPGFLVVTARAVLPLLTLVHVILAMTADTAHRQLLRQNAGLVAGSAFQPLMRPPERELRLLRVVEGRGFPAACGVAALA